MNQDPKLLGSFLRSARQRLGYSLRDVERDIGISNAYLSQLEAGKIKQPAPSVLHRLSEHYQSTYAEVMRLAGHPLPDMSDPAQSQPPANRIGSVTVEEETSLLEYLAFLRSKRRD